jgi:hypothetical protein
MTTEYFPRFQLVDAQGNVISSFGGGTSGEGSNITGTGIASEAKQALIITALENLLAELRLKANAEQNQQVFGEVLANQGGDWSVQLTDGAVTLGTADNPLISEVRGTVAIAQFPEVQQVAGTVAIAQFPEVQPVSGQVVVTNLASQSYRNYNDFGTKVADVVKDSGGSLFSLACFNVKDCVKYLQLFDKATLPVTGEVPAECYPIAGSNLLILDNAYFGLLGRSFETGIAWGLSNSATVYAPAHAVEQITQIKFL